MNKPVQPPRAPPQALTRPTIRLAGGVDDAMLRTFREGLSAAEDSDGPIVVELTTLGGDADVGRAIGLDVQMFRERTGRNPLFYGKAVVYSAGVSIMAGFARQDRWLSRETVLLIHGRKLSKTQQLDGPLRIERKKIEALLGEIDIGLELERHGFEALIEGSQVSLDELYEHIQPDWYLAADDALARGLVAGLV
jgi:ATP-dependent protease ClpP protease subunit